MTRVLFLPRRGGGTMVFAAAVGLLVGLAVVSVLYSPGERVGRGAGEVVELEGVGDAAGGGGGQSGRGRGRGVPLTFWRRKIKGPGPSMDVGMYSAKRYGDPWARADGGSYKLWADASKEPTGSIPLQMTAEQQKAYDDEEPDEKNQKNGWEEYQFDKWVRKQGGEPNKFWKDAGYERRGEEYVLALRRLGIRKFGDLAAFDEADEDKGGDLPGFDCENGEEPEGERSGHYMCGQLQDIAEEQQASPLWWADSRANITRAGIRTATARAQATASRWKRLVTGRRPFDDAKFFCYSKYQEEPEYSACMRTLRANVDPKTGGRKDKGRSWSDMTKGLWGDKETGTVDENEGLMGQSWSQLTSGLWDDNPYKERNGMDY